MEVDNDAAVGSLDMLGSGVQLNSGGNPNECGAGGDAAEDASSSKDGKRIDPLSLLPKCIICAKRLLSSYYST